jgi:D-3-phosphoglycerate dehydrogenase
MAKSSTYTIKTYNQISKAGLSKFKPNYKVNEKEDNPDAIMLRSFDLHNEPIAGSVLAVGRAGAGVNNIPVNNLSQRGVAVFSAPGANANSVKEIVIASLIIAGRNLAEALQYTGDLSGDNMKASVEAGKKKFVGSELTGKTLGVIGLGAIGYRVANAGVDLDMKVLGYDPAMTVRNAWQLSADVNQIDNMDQLLEQSDYVTIHVPLLDSTKGMISAEKIKLLKPGAILVNFSRDALVDEKALLTALDKGKMHKYVTDFPNPTIQGHAKVIAFPHLGASTAEAEDNCAIMVAGQLQDYIENGNVRLSVNFPTAVLARKGNNARLALAHANKPGVVAQISDMLRDEKINIAELLNKSRGDLAYTIVDLEVATVSDQLIKRLESIPELLKLRVL